MTLETAKQLQQAGWDKETNLLMFEYGEGKCERILSDQSDGLRNETYPCPSTDELLAELPSYLLVPKGNYIVSTKGRVTNEMFLHIKKGELYWACYTDSYSNNLEGFIFSNEVFSEALAQLWLKLRKEGIV